MTQPLSEFDFDCCSVLRRFQDSAPLTNPPGRDPKDNELKRLENRECWINYQLRLNLRKEDSEAFTFAPVKQGQGRLVPPPKGNMQIAIPRFETIIFPTFI